MLDIEASLIEFAKIKFCLVFSPIFINELPFGFKNIPKISDENMTEIYNFIPRFMLENIPAPTPKITNAAEGLLQITKSDFKSVSVIKPCLCWFAAALIPTGKPQIFPSK